MSLFRFIKPCETRWLSESSALDRVHEQYAGLLVYVHDVIETERLPDCVFLSNSLCTLSVCLSMPLVSMVMSEINLLVKQLQRSDVLFTQVAAMVDTTVYQLNKHFVASGTRYADKKYFSQWFKLTEVSEGSCLKWMDGDLVYRVTAKEADDVQNFEMYCENTGAKGGRATMVKVKTKQQFATVLKSVQETVTKLAANAVAAIKARFPPSNVLQALSVVQLGYWRDEKLGRKDFDIAVSTLSDLYGSARKTGVDKEHAPLIDAEQLSIQSSFYWDYMTAVKFDGIDTETHWKRVDNDEFIACKISQFQTVAHIVMSMPSSSVECERSFSLMALLKDGRRNRLLSNHLNACMRFGRTRFTVKDYPFDSAYQHWTKSERYML